MKGFLHKWNAPPVHRRRFHLQRELLMVEALAGLPSIVFRYIRAGQTTCSPQQPISFLLWYTVLLALISEWEKVLLD